MKLPSETIAKLFGKAVELRRTNWEGLIEEVYDYYLPNHMRFDQTSPGLEHMDKVFDETAIVGLQEFASNLYSGLTPSESVWLRPVVSKRVPERERIKIQEQLDEQNAIVFEFMNSSNMVLHFPSFYQDIGVGTGNMFVDENNSLDDPLNFCSVSQPLVWMLPGPDGRPDHRFRARNARVEEIERKYDVKLDRVRNGKSNDDKTEMVTLVECSYRDWSVYPQEAHHFHIFYCDKKDFRSFNEKVDFSTGDIYYRRDIGQGSCPWITPRFDVMTGEVYGRGPAIITLPATRTLNLVHQLILENAELAIEGIWTAENDGNMNPDTIVVKSGTVWIHEKGSNGLRNVTTNSRFDVANLIIRNMQENIRRGLYNEDYGPLGTTPISAQEVAARRNTFNRILGSVSGRLRREAPESIWKRVVYILGKKKLVEFPKIDKRLISYVAMNPFARDQRFEEISNVRSYLSDMGAILKEQIGTKVNLDNVHTYIREHYQLPANFQITDADTAAGIATAGQPGNGGELNPAAITALSNITGALR